MLVKFTIIINDATLTIFSIYFILMFFQYYFVFSLSLNDIVLFCCISCSYGFRQSVADIARIGLTVFVRGHYNPRPLLVGRRFFLGQEGLGTNRLANVVKSALL